MRAFAHICAILLLLPQVILATAFTMFGYLVQGGGFTHMMQVLSVLFGWGGLSIVIGAFLLFLAGFFPRARPVAAIVLVVIAVVSSLALIRSFGPPSELGHLAFFIPALFAVTLASGVAHRDFQESAK